MITAVTTAINYCTIIHFRNNLKLMRLLVYIFVLTSSPRYNVYRCIIRGLPSYNNTSYVHTHTHTHVLILKRFWAFSETHTYTFVRVCNCSLSLSAQLIAIKHTYMHFYVYNIIMIFIVCYCFWDPWCSGCSVVQYCRWKPILYTETEY